LLDDRMVARLLDFFLTGTAAPIHYNKN